MRGFARFALKEGVSAAALAAAADDLERGQGVVDLGGGLVKLRVARPGQGKSGGWRVILAFRAGARIVFIHGFGKNQKANVSAKELVELKRLAAIVLELDPAAAENMIARGDWIALENFDAG